MHSPDDRPLELSDYVRVVRRRRLIILVGAAIGALLLWVFTLATGPVYEAETSILVRPVVIGAETTGRPDQLVNLQTERELIRSASVVQRAADIVGSGPSGLLDRLSITIPENTQILELSFSGDTPEEAQQGAQAFAAAYLAHRRNEAERDIAERISRVTGEITTVEAQLATASQRLLASQEGTLERTLAAADTDRLTTRLIQLGQEQSALELINIDAGEIISPAGLPTRPASQPSWLLIAIGIAAGMILALPVAFGRERLDSRIWDTEDLNYLQVPAVLGSLNVPVGAPPLEPGELPRAEAIQSYRKLILNAMSSPVDLGFSRLGIVAPASGRHDGRVASDLAAILALMGRHVLLISLDGVPEDESDAADEPSLREALKGKIEFRTLIRISEEIPQLRTVSGRIPRDDPDAWKGFGELIQLLPGATDLLIVNFGPTVESVDTLMTASLMDSVLLLVEAGRTNRHELERAAADLEKNGAKVGGLVFIKR